MTVENLLLLIGAIVSTIYVWGPAVGTMLGLTWGRYYFTECPSDLSPDSYDEVYQQNFLQLEQRKFRPWGVNQEFVMFCGDKWTYRSSNQATFTADDQRSFAIIYQLSAGGAWNVAFQSSFESGSVIFSSNSGINFPVPLLLAPYDQAAIASKEIDDLIAFHESRIERYLLQGDKLVSCNSAEVFKQGGDLGIRQAIKAGLAGSANIPDVMAQRTVGYIIGGIAAAIMGIFPVSLSLKYIAATLIVCNMFSILVDIFVQNWQVREVE